MKPTKHNIKLTLQKGLVLSVKGEYVPEESMIWTYKNGDPGHPGCPSEFIIGEVNLEEGTLTQLLDWIDSRNRNIYEYLEELCIKEIENQ